MTRPEQARVTYVDGRPFHGYWRIRPLGTAQLSSRPPKTLNPALP